MRLGLRQLFFLSATLAMAACAYFYGIGSAGEQRELLRADIAAKQKSIAELHESTAGVDQLQQKIADLHRSIDQFQSKLPQPDQVQPLLGQLSRMAAANSLRTQSMKSLAPLSADTYRALPVEIALAGDFNGFYAFLLQVEKLPRLMRITKMKLQPSPDGDVQAQLTLSIYLAPERSDEPVAKAAKLESAALTFEKD